MIALVIRWRTTRFVVTATKVASGAMVIGRIAFSAWRWRMDTALFALWANDAAHSDKQSGVHRLVHICNASVYR